MKPFHVVIKTSTGCELLSREGYDSKGIARRAWSTATRGAVLLEDGMVIEAKGGTVLAVENELRRNAARLMREIALTSAPDDEEEAEEERDEEADDEDDEPAPRPYKEPPVVEPVVAAPSKRSAPVRASKPAPEPVRPADTFVAPEAPTPKGCEHCGVAAPDHRYDCPVVEIVFDAPQTAQEAQEAAPVEPVKTAPVAVVEAPSAASEGCVAKGCKLPCGEPRSNTPVEIHCLCPGHRALARGIVKGRHIGYAEAVEILRAEVRAPYPTNAERDAKKTSKKAPAKASRGVTRGRSSGAVRVTPALQPTKKDLSATPARSIRQTAPVADSSDPLDIVRRLGAAVARLGGLAAADSLGAVLDGSQVRADELAVALGRAGGPVRALAMIDAVLSLEVA